MAKEICDNVDADCGNQEFCRSGQRSEDEMLHEKFLPMRKVKRNDSDCNSDKDFGEIEADTVGKGEGPKLHKKSIDSYQLRQGVLWSMISPRQLLVFVLRACLPSIASANI